MAAMPAANSQTKGMELGVLDCKVEGGAGFIIGSTKDVLCTYRPANKEPGAGELPRHDQQDRARYRRYR